MYQELLRLKMNQGSLLEVNWTIEVKVAIKVAIKVRIKVARIICQLTSGIMS